MDMKDEQVDEDRVWSAIRYLDPDQRAKKKESNTVALISVLALLGTVYFVWGLLWLRFR